MKTLFLILSTLYLCCHLCLQAQRYQVPLTTERIPAGIPAPEFRYMPAMQYRPVIISGTTLRQTRITTDIRETDKKAWQLIQQLLSQLPGTEAGIPRPLPAHIAHTYIPNKRSVERLGFGLRP